MEQQLTTDKTFLGIRTRQIPVWLMLCVFWFLQDNFFALFSIYSAQSPSYVPYRWLDYHFSALFFIPIILGIICAYKNRRMWGFVLIAAILIRSYIISQTRYGETHNMFYMKEYEIVLTLFVGICLYEWFRNVISREYSFSWSRFFLYFVLIHVMSQIAAVAFSINKLVDRYNAINLDVETTGYICGFAFIYFLTSAKTLKHRNLLLFIFMLGGLLSGSRTALLLSVVTLIIYWILKPKKAHIMVNFYLLISILIAIIVFLVVLLVKPGLIESFFSTRLSALARFSDILKTRSDSSVEGRSQSIMAGFNIIQKNPWGGDAYFTQLQVWTNQEGYPTFPHSSVLVYYILLGPVILVPMVIYSVRNTVKRLKAKAYRPSLQIVMCLLYFYVFFIVTGAPIVNYKVVFIYLLVYEMCFHSYDEDEAAMVI